MAAYVQDIATFNTTAGVKTAVITPAKGALLVVFVAHSGLITVPALTDDQSGTYDRIQTSLRTSSGSAAFIFIRTSFAANVAHTLTMTPNGTDTGGGLDVVEVSGMSRLGRFASRQSTTNDNLLAGAAPTAVFTGVCLTANMVLAGLHANDNPNSATAPTGYTQRQNLGYNTPAASLGVYTRDSGETTTTISWGGTETSTSGTLAVELDISGMTQNERSFQPVPFIPKGRSL